jgi:glycosidase
MLTLPQTPVIYYGTEIGMSHAVSTSDRERGGDALARQDMVWERERWDEHLHALFGELIRFRRDATDAVRGGRTRLHLDSTAQTYAYGLGEGAGQPGEGDGRYVVVFNLADDTREVPLALCGEQVVSTGPDVGMNQSSLTVPGRTGAIIRVSYLR